MNIELAWLDHNKRAIVYTFKAGWSWNDFTQCNKMATELLDSIDHKADIIMDFSARTVPPSNALTNFRRMMRDEPHPNQGRIILVGARILFRTIARQFIALTNRSSREIVVTDSIEAAHELVATYYQVEK